MPNLLTTDHRVRGLAILVAAAVVACGCDNHATTISKSTVETNAPRGVGVGHHEFEFHDIAAGNEVSDGWVRAKSSTAGFSVLLPGKYNDFHQSGESASGNRLTSHTVGMTTSGGVKYSVTAFEGGDPKPPNEGLAAVVARFEKSGDLREKRDLVLNGNPGIQIVLGNSRSGATMRAYAFTDMFYMLIAEYPIALAASEASNVDKFLTSFRPKEGQ